ncbi:hypothetical protein C0J52_20428 [Blattella germanica]|nr:hypothetical protein C0J52_20428 [Blattella germanica]
MMARNLSRRELLLAAVFPGKKRTFWAKMNSLPSRREHDFYVIVIEMFLPESAGVLHLPRQFLKGHISDVDEGLPACGAIAQLRFAVLADVVPVQTERDGWQHVLHAHGAFQFAQKALAQIRRNGVQGRFASRFHLHHVHHRIPFLTREKRKTLI